MANMLLISVQSTVLNHPRYSRLSRKDKKLVMLLLKLDMLCYLNLFT